MTSLRTLRREVVVREADAHAHQLEVAPAAQVPALLRLQGRLVDRLDEVGGGFQVIHKSCKQLRRHVDETP